MMPRKTCFTRSWSTIALLAMSMLVGVAHAAQRGLKEIRVAYPPSMASVTLMTGIKQKFFEEQGLTLTLLVIASDLALKSQVVGEIDYTLFGGGTGMVGMWKAFDELEHIGWVKPGRRPRMVSVQAANCAPIVRAFEELMEQEDLTPDWLALRHRLTFMLRQLRHRSSRLSDIRVSIYGPAAITALARRSGELQHALPKQSFYAVHAEPKRFFEPADFSALLADPEIIGLHISPKGRGGEKPIPGSLYAWAAEKFGK